MKQRIRILITSIAIFGVIGGALAIPPRGSVPFGAQGFGKQIENPPTWLVGNWIGHNDFRRTDVDLRVSSDGRSTLSFRLGASTNTLRGWFRSGKLDFDGERYLVKQERGDISLTREGERRDTALLHSGRPSLTVGGDLTIDEPGDNARLRSGVVFIRGSSNAGDLGIDVFRGSDKVYSTTISPRSGHFEVRTNLEPGHYYAVVRSRDRARLSLEKRVSFVVGELERTTLETPEVGGKYNGGTVLVSGTSGSPDVEIEITRGRDRVFIEQVAVRNGRFSSRPTLSWGTYIVTVHGKQGGNITDTAKRGFEVLGAPDTGRGNGDFRLDRPADRTTFRSSTVDFDGVSSGTDVRVQIFRGREKIYNELVSVRGGHFHLRVQLASGPYDATVMGEDRGRVQYTKKISFEVLPH